MFIKLNDVYVDWKLYDLEFMLKEEKFNKELVCRIVLVIFLNNVDENIFKMVENVNCDIRIVYNS